MMHRGQDRLHHSLKTFGAYVRKPPKGSCPGDIFIRCLNYLCQQLSVQRSSRSILTSPQMMEISKVELSWWNSFQLPMSKSLWLSMSLEHRRGLEDRGTGKSRASLSVPAFFIMTGHSETCYWRQDPSPSIHLLLLLTVWIEVRVEKQTLSCHVMDFSTGSNHGYTKKFERFIEVIVHSVGPSGFMAEAQISTEVWK